ncbi:Acyl-coenzyme A thioesterase 8 [Aphelenchoides besseyi]|nr:Acyl-coenzyme A thioesterase 8 [Aphelenchoides besseyi]
MKIVNCLFSASKSNAQLTNVMRRPHDDIGKLITQVLHLDQIDENKFRANHLLQGRMFLDAVYGGQAYSSTVRAASLTVNKEFLPHSAHAYFIKSGDVNQPVDFNVKRVRDGRSFCTRYVEATQNDKLLTTALISFHVQEEAAVRHQQPMNEYCYPESLKSWPEVLEEAAADSRETTTSYHKKMIDLKMRMTPPIFNKLLDIRPLDPDRWSMRSLYNKNVAPTHHIYVKAKASPGVDQIDHRILGAFISDITLMETALVDHMASGFFPTMLYSLDNNVYFHSDINLNDWLLIECTSPIAENGRAYAEARAWNVADRKIVMSMSQEGIVRLTNKKK